MAKTATVTGVTITNKTNRKADLTYLAKHQKEPGQKLTGTHTSLGNLLGTTTGLAGLWGSHPHPTATSTNALSTQQEAVATTIAKAMGLKTPETPKKPLTPVLATPEQWKRISETAKARLAAKTPTKQAEKQIKAAATSPFTKLVTKDIIQPFEQTLKPTSIQSQLIDGQAATAAVKQGATAAESYWGLSPTSDIGKWLGSTPANFGTQNPALQAYESAYQAGGAKIAKALTNVTKANQVQIATAPERTFLTAEARNAQYNYETTGEYPAPLQAALTKSYPGLAQQLAQSTLSGTSTAGLVTPSKAVSTTTGTHGTTPPPATKSSPG